MKRLYCFENAQISIAGKAILKDVTLDIYQGRHIVLSGENGSGKTTFCKAIAGHLFVTKGSARATNIEYNEIKLVSFTDDGKLFHSVNNVHYYQQRFNSWDADGFITVKEYLISKDVDLEKKENLEFIGRFGLTQLLNTERIKLSSGQTRKLLLTSAVLSNPKLLILDNPYIGLDTTSRQFLNTFLEDLVTHTDITLILSGQFSTLPNCIYKKYIVHQQSISESGEEFKIDNISLKKGELDRIKELYSSLRSTSTQGPSIEYINFSKTNISYGSNSILKDFNWTINRGERWSLSGENGTGKSTIVSMIYADHPQIYSQQIRLFGQRFGKGRSIWEVKQEIGFTSPELHAYFRSDLSAEEVVWTGLFDKFEVMGTVDHKTMKMCTFLFRYYNLEEQLKNPYRTLSTGHQRICLLIRALIKAPKILLLDEPFQGLDDRNIALSKTLLDHIIQPDQALLFISHFDNELPLCIDLKLNLVS